MLYELVPSLDKSKANQLARQLASLREFQSLDSNTESDSLKARIKKVSQKILDAAERRRKASTSTNDANGNASKVRNLPLDVQQDKVDSHHILINTVGELKYNEIISVSKEIKEIRQHSTVWTNFSQQHSRSPGGDDDEVEEEEEQAPASETLPTPIADIYFRTRLMDVMRVVDAKKYRPLHEVPGPRECNIVQQLDWNSLLNDVS